MMIAVMTLRLVLRRPLRDRLPRAADPQGRLRRRGPRRAGAHGRRHPADPAGAEHQRAGIADEPRLGQGPLLAQRAAGIGRRDPDHAGPRGPHRVAPGGDDHQRRRGRGEDVAGQLPGDQPGAERAADPADRRRPAQPDDPPALRPAPWPGAQRGAPRRGGPGRRDRGHRRRGPDRSWPPGNATVRPSASSRRAASARCSTSSRSDSIS